MKIKLIEQFGLVFKAFPEIGLNLKQVHMDTKRNQFVVNTPEFMREREVIIDRLLKHSDFKDYLITNTVKEIAAKIKVGVNFNYKLLSTIKEQSSTYLLGRDRFVRFVVKGGDIFVMHVTQEWGTGYIDYEMFRIDVANGSMEGATARSWDMAEELIQYLIFINLSDVEVHFLPPNRKVGTKKIGTFKNETKYNVTIVNSAWNKFVVRTEAFGVSGHLRLQPCGVNNAQRKLVWIEPYVKQGYVRKASVAS
jgi:hypothetical protein